jgi:hypothetical protein
VPKYGSIPGPLYSGHPVSQPSEPDFEAALWALRGYDIAALGTTGVHGPSVAGFFFAPEREGNRLRLLVAVLRDSGVHRDILADPRVAFMCSPGNPSRWVQGWGTGTVIEDPGRHLDLFTKVLRHAPGSRLFIRNQPVLPVIVEVARMKVVADASAPPLVLVLDPSFEAA